MYFTKAAIFLALATSSIAAPLEKRADVLAVQQYAQFQVSDGVSGNALAEVKQKFPVCLDKVWARLDLTLAC
jgi:hypothetical protein